LHLRSLFGQIPFIKQHLAFFIPFLFNPASWNTQTLIFVNINKHLSCCLFLSWTHLFGLIHA